MLHGSFLIILRKTQHRKCIVLLIVGVFVIHICSRDLLKRSEGEIEEKLFRSSSLKKDRKLDLTTRQRLRRMAIIKDCRNRNVGKILPAGSEKGVIPRYAFSNLIVNDKHRFIYCQVPKVATSNWKRVIMVLNGNASDPWQVRSADVHNKTRGYFRYLNEYSSSEIIVRLKTYYKFMFVRHPFERLVSAYRNKFVESYNLTFFSNVYGRYIIRKFRKGAKFQDFEKVSFPEFVRYVLEEDDDVMNDHWRSYDELCRPCLVYYDFIGHFEELAQDTRDILGILGVSDKVSFPMNISSKYSIPTPVLARQYFTELSRDSKRKLYEKYRNDFDMSGYKIPEE